MRLCGVNVVIIQPVVSARNGPSDCSYTRKYLREDDHVRSDVRNCWICLRVGNIHHTDELLED